ncbi:phage major capsid protein [Campylobacter sp. RM16190]|uniref:phage major capsid protein n=1 Tax=Campylobacter sp. RM16190 TaxID=1705727 RepID=UPI001473B035|nr:phage major capsid protein [Campylobacter sp. RM16190]
MNKLQQLREEASKLLADMRGILATAEKENRSTTQEENAKYDAMERDFDAKKAEIQRFEALEKADKFMASAPEFEAQKGSVKSDDAYTENFWRYIRGAEFERNALSTTDANGGYTVPKTFQTSVIELLNKECLMRKLCSVMTTANTNLIPVEASRPQFGWIQEAAAYQETGLTFAQIQIGAHKAGGIIKISEELLNDSAINIEAYVKGKMVDGLALLEEEAFIKGDGNNKPKGLITGITAGITTGASDKFTADEVIDMFYSLAVGYRNQATWLVSDVFEKELRKLKDKNNRYLWEEGLTVGAPNTILGRPVYVSEFMDNELSAGKQPAIFGDLKYYQIADRGAMGLQRLNELYAGNGQVGFRIYKRTDGKLTLADAVKSFKMK